MIDIEPHHSFFQAGTTRSVAWRKEQLRLLLKTIEQHEGALYQAFQTDLHKSEFETFSTEIGLVKRSIRYTLKNLSKWTKRKHKRTPLAMFGRTSYTVYEPYGTVLIIGPFNYPFLTLIEPLIGSIASGNTTVLKPSELTANISSVIRQMIQSVFEPNYIQVVTGDMYVSQELLEKPFDLIFFTGSLRVGKIVMEKASQNLTPVILELGGKSPVIVCEDADVKLAARRIIWGKLLNAGQVCVAPDYCLVHTSLIEPLIDAMKCVIKEMHGDDAKLSKDYGRIINEQHAKRLSSLIEAHQKDIVYGGACEASDRYIEPTLLLLDSCGGGVMEEEIFGPILPIIGFSSLTEVYALIHKNPKPLAMYVFGKNNRVTDEILTRISSGGAMVNDVSLYVGNEHLPFGGVSSSGMGRYHGKYNIEAFSHEKAIMKTWFHGGDSLLQAPYTAKKLSVLKRLFK